MKDGDDEPEDIRLMMMAYCFLIAVSLLFLYLLSRAVR